MFTSKTLMIAGSQTDLVTINQLVQTFYKKLVDLFLQKEVETSLNIADI